MIFQILGLVKIKIVKRITTIPLEDSRNRTILILGNLQEALSRIIIHLQMIRIVLDGKINNKIKKTHFQVYANFEIINYVKLLFCE